MKRHNKTSLYRFLSFAMCFFIILETLFGYSNITAHAKTTTDIEVLEDITTDESLTADLPLSSNDKQTIRLSQDIFPDEIFLNYLIQNFDSDKDNELSEEEITQIHKIDVSNLGITSLEGIEIFTNLEELVCRNNFITTLNLDALQNLITLDCSFNQLTSLDLSHQPNLTNLTCVGNARALKVDESNLFDLSTLDDFDIAKTTSWSEEFILEDNKINFPSFTDSLVVTYEVDTKDTTSTHTTLNFSFLFYKNECSDIMVDETTFPDLVLRNLLLDKYDKNKDQILDQEELSLITCLDIASYDIKDLTGLQLLVNLVSFNYSDQQSSELDFSVIPTNVKRYVNDEVIEVDFSDSTNDESIDPKESTKEGESTSHTESETSLESSKNDSNQENTEEKSNLDIESDTIPTKEETNPTSSITDTNDASPDQNLVTIDANTAKPKKTTHNITYQLDGGSNPADAVLTFQEDTTVTLPNPVKKGYVFDGWYKDNNYSLPLSSIPSGTTTDITVYAKWTQLSVNETTTIKKLTASGKGKLTITYPAIEGVKGYEVLCSTAKNFKSNLRTTTTSKTTVTVKNLIKNKTYYVKVRGYLLDSSGEKVYGSYSGVKKIKIKSGVEEVKATSSSAKISSCKITNTDTVTVKAKASKIVKSSDSYYYLFSVPSTQTNIKKLKPIAKSEKSTSVTFAAPLDIEGSNNLLHSKFVIAIKQKSKYQIISSFQYISNPEGAANYTYAFPTTPTKKGLQGYSSSLGINHTVLNIEVNDLIATKSEYGNHSTDEYEYKGKTYYFRRDVANQYAYTARDYERNGAVVYGILLLGWSSKTNLIAPGAREYGYAYYAWNTKDKKVKEQLEATVTYLAEYCCKVSKTGPGIAGWIVGNEVDNFDTWNYAGTSNIDKYTQIYADTFRLVYNATKSVYANARVYVSLDHMWAMSNEGSYGSKAFLEKFNSILQAEGNVNWDIAYHPYPVPLTDADFWNNDFISNKDNSPIINMKNLTVLSNYVKKQYGKNKRIILSEVGFTSQSGEKVQAAAIAYAYYMAEFNPMVDAFIMRSLEDAQVEVDQGLSFGIKGKYAYNVYKYMDTPDSEKYTKFALKVIKAKSWKSIVPKYNAKKFKSMPNR